MNWLKLKIRKLKAFWRLQRMKSLAAKAIEQKKYDLIANCWHNWKAYSISEWSPFDVYLCTKCNYTCEVDFERVYQELPTKGHFR